MPAIPRLRIVLDTNVLVSALLNRNGTPAEIWNSILQEDIGLCVSGPVFTEYKNVLRRPKLGFKARQIEGALLAVQTLGKYFEASEDLRASRDPADNAFLACARASNADYLVTGNRRHFPSVWFVTLILEPGEFLEILRKPQRLQ